MNELEPEPERVSVSFVKLRPLNDTLKFQTIPLSINMVDIYTYIHIWMFIEKI